MEHLTPSRSSSPQRLLIPIGPKGASRCSIRHALRRAAAGNAIEVFLVYILQPIGHCDLLRFRAEQQEAEQRQTRADIFLEEAAAHLLGAGIPCHKFVREADPIQGIRDLVEEWSCTEVVLPSAYRVDVLNGNERRKLEQLEQTSVVTWIRDDGSPVLQLNDGQIAR